jgi:hypothetical protein
MHLLDMPFAIELYPSLLFKLIIYLIFKNPIPMGRGTPGDYSPSPI